MIIKILKYCGYSLFLPLWWIQRLIPRNKNVWVFGAWYGERYSDNSRYLFEYTQTSQSKIQVIWITRNKSIKEKIIQQGGRAYLSNELKGIYFCLMAKNIFVSSGKRDVNYLFINGARWIQLWHGSPLKKIGLDDQFSNAGTFFQSKIVKWLFPFAYEFNYHFTLSNAPIFTEKMSTSFDIPVSRVLETGCPRNDVFSNSQQDAFNKNLRKKFVGCKLIYYLPTFRGFDGAKTIFNSSEYNSDRLEAFLERHNMVFVSKGHFIDNSVSTNIAFNERIIHLKDENVDEINFMFKDADLLVTDYSSAYFDFLLTERPIIFAAFDLKEYIAGSRELYFDYKTAIFGEIIEDWKHLFERLETVWHDSQVEKNLKKRNLLFNLHHDANNSKRVYDYFYNLA